MPESADLEPAPEGAVDEPVEKPPAPLLRLRDGLTGVVDTPEALATAVSALGAGTGPLAIDAERASGYRYSNRAYLIQVRRDGAGSALIDPIAFDSMDDLQQATTGAEWILHAATQDLACLRDVGLLPTQLFDTELAGRLLGYPRVGLATLVEELLGQRMRKEHSAADWSTRPLPNAWLEYAALDVEVLVELRDLLADQLVEAGKDEWARQEFEHLLSFEPTVRHEAWRRTSGAHKVRGRRGQAAVREMWIARDRIAEERDTAPGRIIPDSAIVAGARAMPGSTQALLSTEGFHGRGARRHARDWVTALERARTMDESDLPTRAARSDGPPAPRAWAEKNPEAAARLTNARASLLELSEQVKVPAENLLTPDTLRRVLWAPPETRGDDLPAAVAEHLDARQARAWQIELIGPLIVEAIHAADS